jgi:hypothetical protein
MAKAAERLPVGEAVSLGALFAAFVKVSILVAVGIRQQHIAEVEKMMRNREN